MMNLRLHTLAALLAAALLPQAAAALNLVEAYEAALKNDPVYRAAYYSNESGQENRVLGRSNLLPNVSVNVAGGKNHSDITYGAKEVPQDYRSRSSSLQVRQTLFNLDALARYKQGGLQADYASTLYLGEQQQVALRVVGAYVEVLFKQDQLMLAQAERDAYLERMKVNERSFVRGEGTRTDMLETKARLDVAEAALLEAQDALTDTRVALAGVIGAESGELSPLRADAVPMPAAALSFDAWKNVALERSPELKARQLAVEIGQQEVNKARAGHAPRLDLVASYSKNSSESINTINQDSTTRSVGLQLSMPLYSGGSVSAQTRQAVANREKAKADLEAETNKTTAELRKQYDQLISGVARIEAMVKAAESGRALVVATEQSIKGGVRINLDLLDAQRQLRATERDLAQARYTSILAYLKLRAAAGVLSGDDVRTMSMHFR